MSFYGDVVPGDEFRPSAALANDVRHLINSLHGCRGMSFGASGAGTVRIQVYNATGGTVRGGTAVNFDETKERVGDAVPFRSLSDPKKPWGVILQTMRKKEMGDCYISGPVTVGVRGSGDFAQPSVSDPAVFTRGTEGAPVLFAFGGRALINLGAGTPENYDGPFALRYDAEQKVLKVNGGYLSRNGEFVSVPPAELQPSNGTVCVESILGNGEWSDPVLKFSEPSRECYPVGSCIVSGGGASGSVSVCSYRVPVAVIIVAAECPLSAEADLQ